MSCLKCVLGTELRPLREQYILLTVDPFLQPFFTLLIMSSDEQKLYITMKSNLSFSSLMFLICISLIISDTELSPTYLLEICKYYFKKGI